MKVVCLFLIKWDDTLNILLRKILSFAFATHIRTKRHMNQLGSEPQITEPQNLDQPGSTGMKRPVYFNKKKKKGNGSAGQNSFPDQRADVFLFCFLLLKIPKPSLMETEATDVLMWRRAGCCCCRKLFSSCLFSCFTLCQCLHPFRSKEYLNIWA